MDHPFIDYESLIINFNANGDFTNSNNSIGFSVYEDLVIIPIS